MDIPFEITTIIVFLTALLLTYILIPFMIRKMKEKKMVSKDMNKEGEIYVPKWGGIVVFLGFIIAVLLPLQLTDMEIFEEKILVTALLTISLIAFLGFVDDILDIPDIYRVIFPGFAAIPLMLLMTHISSIEIPLIGIISLNFGTIILPIIGTITFNLYALLLIPIGVVACSNLINLLAGYNGLETCSGIIISIFLIILIFMKGLNPLNYVLIYLLIGLIGASISFLIFNWYPAKMFPGNVLTYLVGCLIAIVVIIGKIEVFGAILLIPQIIEFFLKALSKFKAENFGTCINGKLTYEGKTYSLTHLLIKKYNPTEKQLVLYLMGIQFFFGIVSIISFIFFNA